MNYKNLPYWLQQTLADLMRHEGFREYAYPDPESPLYKRHKKERWGFVPADIILARLGEKASDGAPWTVGFGFTKGVTPTTRMSRTLAEEKLLPIALAHFNQLYRLLPEWDSYPDFVKTVLSNLIYNMGLDKLRGFKNTLKFFRAKEWKKAGDGLVHSLWYKQTGSRAKELVKRMRTGTIESEHKIGE